MNSAAILQCYSRMERNDWEFMANCLYATVATVEPHPEYESSFNSLRAQIHSPNILKSIRRKLSNNYILLNFSIAYKENVQWDIMSLKVSMFPRKRFSWKNNDHGLNGSTINLNKNSTWMIWCTWPAIISVFRLHHIYPFLGPFHRNRIYAYFKWDTFELEKAMQTQQKWRSLRKSTSALRPRKRRWFSFLIKQTSETNLKWFWFALFEEETKNHYFNSNEVYN